MPVSIYLSGPMTGLPENNYPAFHDVARKLRAQGFVVENPAENPAPPGEAWIDYMRMAVPQLLRCGTVVMLPGWGKSRGARVELQLALGLGLEICFWLDQAGRTDVSISATPVIADDFLNMLNRGAGS